LSSLKHVLLAGSKITPALLERFQFLLPNVLVYNCYGPTEATIYCLAKRLGNVSAEVDKNTVSIGTPITGCKAIILKADNTPALENESGELLNWWNSVNERVFSASRTYSNGVLPS
jgi:D-alanine--poly(phosphoribitol) ligase subunit 1